MATAAIKLGIAFKAPSELVKPKDNQVLLSEEDPHRVRCLNDCGFALTNENLDKSDRQNIVDFLKKCTSLSQGKQIHAHALRIGLGKDAFVSNLLLGMYDKNNALEEARSVFDHMSHRNIVTWNSMIGAYSKRLLYLEALHVFRQMHEFAMDPDKVTFLSLLCACASPLALTQGNIIHACIVGSECQSDVVLNNALVNMYGKCGALNMARAVFNNMHQRSVVSWNSMIARYSDHGKGREALEVYKEMRQLGVQPCKNTFISVLGACAILIFLLEGRAIHASIIECGFESDVIVGTALINFYGKCRYLLDARLVFEKVQEHDVALWTALISAHSQQGKDALQLYLEMQKQGMKLDHISLISVLGACEIPAALEEGKIIHAGIVEKGFEFNIAIGNALLNMYGKCGALEDACLAFKKMQHHDIISWNALVAAHSHYGMVEDVYQLIQEMQQHDVKPDEITFVCLLSACSRAGLLEEAEYAFYNMIEEHNITPEMEHYNCMVDLLGRAGHLDEAEDAIHKMPLQPDIQVWVTLLGACSMHGDLYQGERAAENLVNLSPQNTAAHVLLSNIYTTS